MAREFLPKVITANDLFEGDVIYLTKAGTWSRDLAHAHIAHSQEQVETMLSFAKDHAGTVVGAYAMDIEQSADGTALALHFRETFRTRGPSNYFHGKQADKEGDAKITAKQRVA